MTTSGPVDDVVARPGPAPAAEHPLALRLAALVGLLLWLVVATSTVLGGERPGTWQELRRDVVAGSVDEVQVGEGLPAGAQGYATVEVTWRDGLLRRSAEVVQVSGPGVGTRAADVDTVVRQPVPELVRELDPDVRVSSSELSGGPILELMGWQAPGWLVAPFLVGWLGSLALVGLLPHPRLATRWGWRWLVLGVPALGAPAFLLLSGVLRRTPPAPAAGADPRLRGGWALLLALALAAALPG